MMTQPGGGEYTAFVAVQKNYLLRFLAAEFGGFEFVGLTWKEEKYAIVRSFELRALKGLFPGALLGVPMFALCCRLLRHPFPFSFSALGKWILEVIVTEPIDL